MSPFYHARSTVQRFGGDESDYIDIHDWFDETKISTGDFTHRALRHHALGVQWCIEKFGHYIVNSENKKVPVKIIAEMHVTEDCGFIPTVQDWIKGLSPFTSDIKESIIKEVSEFLKERVEEEVANGVCDIIESRLKEIRYPMWMLRVAKKSRDL